MYAYAIRESWLCGDFKRVRSMSAPDLMILAVVAVATPGYDLQGRTDSYTGSDLAVHDRVVFTSSSSHASVNLNSGQL
jgi:hypothetical protein